MDELEEFERWCEESELALLNEQKRQRAFMHELELELIESAFKLYPEVREFQNRFILALKKETHSIVVSINELIDMMLPPMLFEIDKNPLDFDLKKLEEYNKVWKNAFEKVKEMIVKYFPEFPDMSSAVMLYINSTVYINCHLFEEAFLFLTINYRNDSIDDEE